MPRIAIVASMLIGTLALGGGSLLRASEPSGRGGQATADERTAALRAVQPPEGYVPLESIDLEKMAQRRGRPRPATPERPIRLGGVEYPRGVFTQSISEFLIDLHGQAERFQAAVGLTSDDPAGQGTVRFLVWKDDTLAFDSGVLRGGEVRSIDVDLTGARVLQLICDDGGDTSNGDAAAWAGAMIRMAAGAPAPVPYDLPVDPPIPIASSGADPRPRIHSPRIVGATPGRPFLFRIPAGGEGPLQFDAQGLPPGLTLDPATGILRGSLHEAGEWRVAVTVRGPRGEDRNTLTIVGGHRKLALTPPMGWNSWNVWGRAVDQEKVRQAVDALIATGLAAHGFHYVCIDDGWEGERDELGVLQPNEKFPDMKALTDYAHEQGLKVGIYSSPGPTTCQGLPGSYQHEELDARTWASWGIDYLKYDWCGYSRITPWNAPVEEHKKPYIIMRRALDALDRDIVYSLCQYGYANVWEWGADPEVGGNLWRTTGDLLDLWCNLESVGFRQAGRERYIGPGHWNDTDMLVVGSVGWGPTLRPTRLTPNEQILHLTLWVLQAAPLMIGCNLADLDRFTIDLLTNHEVLEVFNDPLGRSNGRVWQEGRLEVWSRPLADGTLAVGLFNRGLQPYPVTARWRDLGLEGPQPVRDLWEQKDLGVFDGAYTATVPRHGARLIKIGAPRHAPLGGAPPAQ